MKYVKYFIGLAVLLLFITGCAKNELGPLYNDTSVVSGKITANDSPVASKFFISIWIDNSYWYGTFQSPSGTYNIYLDAEGTASVHVYVYDSGESWTQWDVKVQRGMISEVNFNL
jgi:hypothetical protein